MCDRKYLIKKITFDQLITTNKKHLSWSGLSFAMELTDGKLHSGQISCLRYAFDTNLLFVGLDCQLLILVIKILFSALLLHLAIKKQ